MHRELELALAPILDDLVVPSGVAPSVRDEEWQDHPGTASCLLLGPDGSGSGVWVSQGQPFAAQVATLADQVQEWAVEALWHLGRPASWPACPHHPARHPLAAVERMGRAVWTCPVLDALISPIGALATAGAGTVRT